METIGNTISAIISAPITCCSWIIVGFIAGALARRLLGSKDMPFISDIILGLAGALVGGFVTSLFGVDTDSVGLQQLLISIVVATLGASILIYLGRVIRGR